MAADRAAESFTRMLHAIDARDWPGVRHEFAPRIDLDYSSLFGDAPARVDADPHVDGWRRFASVFDATQHVTGPFVTSVNADGSVLIATHVRAYHRIQGLPGGDIWMVAGHYRVRLVDSADGWKIEGITLRVLYAEGNQAIPALARERAAHP
jgi:SnoaL-like protein